MGVPKTMGTTGYPQFSSIFVGDFPLTIQRTWGFSCLDPKDPQFGFNAVDPGPTTYLAVVLVLQQQFFCGFLPQLMGEAWGCDGQIRVYNL